MKQKPLSDLMGRHGPEELDDMLHDVEANGETYQLIADAQDGRVIAEVTPPSDPWDDASQPVTAEELKRRRHMLYGEAPGAAAD